MHQTRINYTLQKFNEWYKGDGTYGDGKDFHWDYYNSYVIQPMLIDVSSVLIKHNLMDSNQFNKYLIRAQRYSTILERLISPEGTYPIIGRSSSCRMGTFQLLSQISLLKKLPNVLPPAQVRTALTAVMKKQLNAPGTYDKNGWMKVGVYGSQLNLGEDYVSTGSLYHSSLVFLPLGLPVSDPFWNSNDLPWTQKIAWSGGIIPIDHSI